MRSSLFNVDICHLTSVHDPLDTRIYRKECRSLSQQGYRVALVAAWGEGGLSSEEIKAVSLPTINNRCLRILMQPWIVLFSTNKISAKVYHFHDPELLITGILLKLMGQKVVYDVHESVGADILAKSYLPKLLRKLAACLASALEKIGDHLFDGIVAATPFIAQGFNPAKTVVVQNFPLKDELAAPAESEKPADKALYMGSMSDIRGIIEMVRAMALLPADTSTRLVLVGRFSDQVFEKRLRAMPGWARVEYYPWQDRNSLSRIMSSCRVGLILLRPAPNHYYAYPNKLFEYMSAGLPVLASNFPLWRNIVEGSGCGQVVDPTDPGKIAESISWFMAHPSQAQEMGRRGRTAVNSLYNWEQEVVKLLEFYESLIGPPDAREKLTIGFATR